MSTLVVQDVTNALPAAASAGKGHGAHSSITPFKKVLQQERENRTQPSNAAASANKSSEAVSAIAGPGSGQSAAKGTLDGIFKQASQKYNISYDFLVAVAKAESDFDTNCVSSAGAKGIMQLMPDECKEFKVSDPFDAEQNIMASARLLKAHLEKFNGDFTLAAAAYNAGSGAVKKYGGVPPYTETQNYVKRIRKFMSEGVKVPNKKVKVSGTGESSGSGSSATVEKKSAKSRAEGVPSGFDKGETATDSDLEQVMVSVGTGESTVKMTYGAYLRYLELGTTGVG